jgi:hypothetical protein
MTNYWSGYGWYRICWRRVRSANLQGALDAMSEGTERSGDYESTGSTDTPSPGGYAAARKVLAGGTACRCRSSVPSEAASRCTWRASVATKWFSVWM